MAIFIEKFKIAYFPVPKIACTSLKDLFFRLENNLGNSAGVCGDPVWPLLINGEKINIHTLYQTKNFGAIDLTKYSEYQKFAIVRHPVDRLVSCWRNRVIRYKELSSECIQNEIGNLQVAPPDPDFEEFVDKLHVYRRMKSIKHHTDLMANFLGTDVSVYTKIFRLDQISEFKEHINGLTGLDLKLNHLQTAPAINPNLSTRLIEKIERIYRVDFDTFGYLFEA